MNAITWITLGILAGAFSLFAIPYGFSLRGSEKIKPPLNVSFKDQQQLSNHDEHLQSEQSDEINTSPKETVKPMLGYDADENKIRQQYQIALKIPGSITKTSTLEKLSKNATDLGYYNTAFEIALQIPGSITQTSTLSYVAIKTANSGNLDLALKIADKISGSITKTETLQKISNM